MRRNSTCLTSSSRRLSDPISVESAVALSTAAVLLPANAQQQYPSQDIHVICAFPAGSGADVLVRYFAMKLPHHWWVLGVDVQLQHDLDHQQQRRLFLKSDWHRGRGKRWLAIV